VAQTARRIVQIAFARNSRLQNVDVVGVVLSDPGRDGVKYPVFNVGTVPIWTASVERESLTLANVPAWLNLPNIDAGSWLRARSQIYINPRVLPNTAIRVAGIPLFESAANAATETATLRSSSASPINKTPDKTLSTTPRNVVPRSTVAPTSSRPSQVVPFPTRPRTATSMRMSKPPMNRNALAKSRRAPSSTRIAPQFPRPPVR
jgi:hypothetical protein